MHKFMAGESDEREVGETNGGGYSRWAAATPSPQRDPRTCMSAAIAGVSMRRESAQHACCINCYHLPAGRILMTRTPLLVPSWRSCWVCCFVSKLIPFQRNRGVSLLHLGPGQAIVVRRFVLQMGIKT